MVFLRELDARLRILVVLLGSAQLGLWSEAHLRKATDYSTLAHFALELRRQNHADTSRDDAVAWRANLFERVQDLLVLRLGRSSRALRATCRAGATHTYQVS